MKLIRKRSALVIDVGACVTCARPFLSVPDTPTTLVLRHVPLPLTCGVFDGTIITDPSLLEEELLTTQVTVVSTAEGKVRAVPNSLGRNYVCSRTSAAGCKVFSGPLFDSRCYPVRNRVLHADCTRPAGVRSSQTWGKLRIRRAAERMSATLPATCRGTRPNPQGSCVAVAKRRRSLTILCHRRGFRGGGTGMLSFQMGSLVLRDPRGGLFRVIESALCLPKVL